MSGLGTVLIVMTLAVSPATRLVCDVSCGTKASSIAPADSACHDALGRAGSYIQPAPIVCEDSTAIVPFLIEVTYKTVPTATGEFAIAPAPGLRQRVHRIARALPQCRDTGPPAGHTITILRA